MALQTVFESSCSQALAVECRTCSSMGAIHPIFAPIEGAFIVPLSEMLTDCTGIEVREGDLAPAFLCGDCAQTLLMMYKFKKTAVEKDQSRRNNVIGAEYQVVETFNSNRSHIDHDRTHTKTQNTNKQDGTPKKCSDCTEVFTTKTSLRRHRQENHTQMFKYSCDICPRKFKTPTKLSRHLTIMHGELSPIGCPICPRRFHSNGSFGMHMKRDHNQKIKNPKNNKVKQNEAKSKTPKRPSVKINIRTEPQDRSYKRIPVQMEPPW